MRELTGVLKREGDRLHPRPDLGEVLRRSARRRRRRGRARLAGTAALLAAVLGLASVVVRSLPGEDRIETSADGQPLPVDVARIGGLILTGAGPDLSFPAGTLERKDAAAADGPWALVLRRDGGDLGDGTVVVTYPQGPVPGPDGEVRSSESGGVTQTSLTRWLSAGTRLQFSAVGVAPEELLAVADAVAVEAGRPVFRPGHPTGAGSWQAVAAGPSRSPLVAEARYGCDSLGEGDVLGAMCYVGLTSSPGFEAALLARPFQPGPELDGRPTAVSIVGGGSSTLAWELDPGVVAYVGYSGNIPGPDQVAALHRLATRAELIDPEAWVATQPSVSDQENDWVGP